MKKRWWLVPVSIPCALLMSPKFASAEIESGECTGSAQFVNGTKSDGSFTLDADQPRDEVVVVPRSDTVQWAASTPATGGDYSGSITIDLPFPLGSYEVESWSGTVEANSNSGTDSYDLPAAIPSGVEFEVSATHTDSAGTCAGSLTVRIEGGSFGSPVTSIALVVTAVLGAMLVAVAGVIGGSGGSGAAAAVTSAGGQR